uniref:WAP domain-containing protein n=1 Tax=Laticauda laticaudata TaxID=8630 RepID=A0A8C5WNQ7_LATLA
KGSSGKQSLEKPGECPTNSCFYDKCRTDYDCEEKKKCCYYCCSMNCVNPGGCAPHIPHASPGHQAASFFFCFWLHTMKATKVFISPKLCQK